MGRARSIVIIRDMKSVFMFMLSALALSSGVAAQERPYFVTYDHQLEEPGSFEVGLNPVLGTQRDAGGFAASTLEMEYGVKGWWTTEVYLSAQGTRDDSAAF